MLEPYQERIIEEKQELDLKITKLKTFMSDIRYSKLSLVERHYMLLQSKAMEIYAYILWVRILDFSESVATDKVQKALPFSDGGQVGQDDSCG